MYPCNFWNFLPLVFAATSVCVLEITSHPKTNKMVKTGSLIKLDIDNCLIQILGSP